MSTKGIMYMTVPPECVECGGQDWNLIQFDCELFGAHKAAACDDRHTVDFDLSDEIALKPLRKLFEGHEPYKAHVRYRP